MKQLLLLLLIMSAAGRGDSAELEPRSGTPEDIIFPVFYSMESGDSNIGGMDVGKECRFSRDSAVVWSDEVPLERYRNLLRGFDKPAKLSDALITKTPFRESYVTKTGTALLGKPWTQATAMLCYTIYASAAQFVVDSFKQDVQKQFSQKDGELLLVSDAVSARKAFDNFVSAVNGVSAISAKGATKDFYLRINKWESELNSTTCSVPTAKGAAQGLATVTCGQWELNHRTRTIKRAGVTMLSPEMVNGRRIRYVGSDTYKKQAMEAKK